VNNKQLVRITKCQIIALIFGFLLFSSVSADVVSIKADELYPINMDPHGKELGLFVDLSTDALKAAGHTVDYGLMPFDVALASVRSGSLTCIPGISKSDAPDFVFTKNPWLKGMRATLYVSAKRAVPVKTIADLGRFQIGAKAKYTYGSGVQVYLDKYAADSTHLYFARGLHKPVSDLSYRVLTGHLDGLIEFDTVMDATLPALRLQGKLVPQVTLDAAVDYYMACSPKVPNVKNYIQAFDQYFEQMQAQGKLAAYYERYHLSAAAAAK
jgi:polar amino acid transport system substrate-binding protein